jgi:hypothetical protein
MSGLNQSAYQKFTRQWQFQGDNLLRIVRRFVQNIFLIDLFISFSTKVLYLFGGFGEVEKAVHNCATLLSGLPVYLIKNKKKDSLYLLSKFGIAKIYRTSLYGKFE